MKKIIFIVSIIILLSISAVRVNAITTSPTPTETDLQQKAQKLLELVASDTAKLNLTEKRGVIGTVTDTTGTQITIDDVNGNTRFIDVDELTKFNSPTAKGTFGISDIQKGNKIGVLGLYNKSSRRILARFVDIVTLPSFIHGAVSTIDNENFNFDVITDANKTLNIDVATVTKIFTYTAADGMVKSGFSKITEAESVVIVGYTDKKIANKIVPSFIILLLEVAKNPSITIPGTTSSGEIPSTGSGKILTPKTY